MNALLRRRILERDMYTCQKCGSKEEPTVDHIKPKAWGGTDAESNLETLCKECNRKKGCRIPEEVVEVRRTIKLKSVGLKVVTFDEVLSEDMYIPQWDNTFPVFTPKIFSNNS